MEVGSHWWVFPLVIIAVIICMEGCNHIAILTSKNPAYCLAGSALGMLSRSSRTSTGNLTKMGRPKKNGKTSCYLVLCTYETQLLFKAKAKNQSLDQSRTLNHWNNTLTPSHHLPSNTFNKIVNPFLERPRNWLPDIGAGESLMHT